MVESQHVDADASEGTSCWDAVTLCRHMGPGLLPFSHPDSSSQRVEASYRGMSWEHSLAPEVEAGSGVGIPWMELPLHNCLE